MCDKSFPTRLRQVAKNNLRGTRKTFECDRCDFISKPETLLRIHRVAMETPCWIQVLKEWWTFWLTDSRSQAWPDLCWHLLPPWFPPPPMVHGASEVDTLAWPFACNFGSLCSPLCYIIGVQAKANEPQYAVFHICSHASIGGVSVFLHPNWLVL